VIAEPPLETIPTTGFAALQYQMDKQAGKARPLKPLAGEELIEAAEAAARLGFLGAMPRLTKRSNAQASIACVAVGVQRRYITGSEARTMLYTAQLALGAFPKRQQQKGRNRK
jgi:hypothetical protein